MKSYVLVKNDDLVHYGVLGMHWGIRRYQPYSVRPRGSGKTGVERINKNQKKVIKTENSYEIKKNGKVVSKLNYYDYNIKNFDWVLMANLETNKEYRGQGLATTLIDNLYSDVVKKKKGVYMFVRENNANALSLYNKLGFEKIDNYVLSDGKYVIMAKGNANKKQFKGMNFS